MVSELQEITHKQFNAIRKIIQEQNKMYNKEIEKLKKYQTNFGADQYNHWTKEFNESFNSRLDQTEKTMNSKTGHLKVSSERHENKNEEKEWRKPTELMGHHDKK